MQVLEYDRYQRGLAVTIFNFFNKNLEDTGIKSMSNYQLANKLHKSIIKKFKRRNVYSSLKDHIWGVYLADVL